MVGASVVGGELVVDGVHVEVELARVLGIELTDLQLDDHEAALGVVVEEQVGGEVAVADRERELAPVEGEALAERGHEALDVGQQGELEIALTAQGCPG